MPIPDYGSFSKRYYDQAEVLEPETTTLILNPLKEFLPWTLLEQSKRSVTNEYLNSGYGPKISFSEPNEENPNIRYIIISNGKYVMFKVNTITQEAAPGETYSNFYTNEVHYNTTEWIEGAYKQLYATRRNGTLSWTEQRNVTEIER